MHIFYWLLQHFSSLRNDGHIDELFKSMDNYEPIVIDIDTISNIGFSRYGCDHFLGANRFREKYIIVNFLNGRLPVITSKDGLEWGSSMVEEIFGGLVRRGMPIHIVHAIIELMDIDDPSYKIEASEYAEQAWLNRLGNRYKLVESKFS